MSVVHGEGMHVQCVLEVVMRVVGRGLAAPRRRSL